MSGKGYHPPTSINRKAPVRRDDDLYFANREVFISGERWKAVKDFEGFYEVSDLGRVRSLDRVVEHPRLYKQTVFGRILIQKVVANRNKLCPDAPTIDLRVSLSKLGKTYTVNVRRIIFEAFHYETDFKSNGTIIAHADGNGFNCKPANLIEKTISEKVKDAFKNGRIANFLSFADRSDWDKSWLDKKRKPVRQLKNGVEVKSFTSITAASKETGFGEKEIIRVAKGARPAHAGFVWEYIKPAKPILSKNDK